MLPAFNQDGNLPEGIHLNADVFWAKASLGQATLALWLDTYQTGKDFKRRGIVEVTPL